ncbi:GH22578 [Drosophila grimshawi]|uniref:GH22578 n=1 Tax=Drosophila grimshawi TaxID=7222 RepID=B4K3M0_DROGR|nr:GH22578 [Drosophila grimshawi]
MNSPQLVNTSAQAHHSSNSRNNSSNNTSNSNASSNNNNSNNSSSNQTQANQFAPARRLAARQTLRLAIPKQQGDSVTLPHAQTSNIYRHSPSQLPPAPLLKRHTSGGGNLNGGGGNSYIPKSASPLESHKLPNVTPTGSSTTPSIYNGAGGSSSGCSSASSSFLGVRKPSLTLNSSDIRNNNDLFAFAKDMSPALELSGEFERHNLNHYFTKHLIL